MAIVPIALREARLRREVRAHFRSLGFTKGLDGTLLPPCLDKDGYRQIHEHQRQERLLSERRFLEDRSAPLLEHFANGRDIDVGRVAIRMIPIEHTTWQSDLFRLATLLWSVPVSMGFGRRLRYLIWDDYHDKLVGLLALGDPVFNLRARDAHIGWSVRDRETRLVHLLDGYVVGAMPPYNRILGGKLVACLMRTREVAGEFRKRYGSSEGIISGAERNAHLVAVTTTSALGRSSLYNRLRLEGVSYLESIGYTGGYGHFHFPQALFDDMRSYLRYRKDMYAANHRFGHGPNWKFRAIRRVLALLGLNPDLLKHGFYREVFIGRLADNALEILKGTRKRPKYTSLRPAVEVAELALQRWVRPRAARDLSYREHTRAQLLRQINGIVEPRPRVRKRRRG